MSGALLLEGLSLQDQGPALTLCVEPGQSLAVVGPAASGKSRLLRIVAGLERAPEGSVCVQGKVAYAEPFSLPRRTKPKNLVPTRAQARGTDLLLALGLWDHRSKSASELTPAQVAAAELLTPLLKPSGVLVLDGQLDRLDPWTLAGVRKQLEERRRKGTVVVAATNRPELAAEFDAVVALRDGQVRFAGTLPDLLRNGPPHVVTVTTDDPGAVRELVQPFSVRIETTPEGLRMEAEEGQAMAAKLLLEGYGVVELVLVRPPTVEEALLALR
jgi:ABC-type lipoprotein export system ATPase subunit